MALHYYIKKRSHDGLAFEEFDRNLNFIPDNILPDVVSCSGSHGNCSLCRMNFIHDGIANSLMKQ